MKNAAVARATAIEPVDVPDLYPLQDVVRIVGISAALANNWSMRYPGAEIALSGRGKGRRRMVDAELVIRFRLMKILTDVGLPPEDALGVAQKVLLKIAETKKHEAFAIYFFGNGKAVAQPADEPPPPEAEATLQLDVRGIITRVREALDALSASQ